MTNRRIPTSASYLIPVVLLLALFAAACSRSLSPTSVVEQFMTASAKGDQAKVETLVTEGKTSSERKPISNLLLAQMANLQVTYDSEVIEGDMAKVKLTVTQPDLAKILQQGVPPTTEILQNDPDLWPKVLEAIADPSSPKVKKRYEAHLRKEKGGWKLDEIILEP